MAVQVTATDYTAIMNGRIARFDDLEGPFSETFPDDNVPGTSERNIYNVMGFATFDTTPFLPNLVPVAPVSEIAMDKALIKDGEGINIAYVELPPGQGVNFHMHNTNESFIVITGRIMFAWGNADDESVELGPRDVISFPGPVPRRFWNATDETTLHLALNAGDKPAALVDPESIHQAEGREDGATLMPPGYR